ncbi:hypothetical protein [Methanosarcina siciliae]|uniref:hypothetical protein n=1 Tax=Methanosarcina siciliae TaxID=38027 RepID=UPI00064FB493|nr:hypothetical protein [Methanosarcina siciliae]
MFKRKTGLWNKDSLYSLDGKNSYSSPDSLSSSDSLNIRTKLEKGAGSDPCEDKTYNFIYFNYQIKIFAGLGILLLSLFFFMGAVFLLFTNSIGSINLLMLIAFFSWASVISVYYIRKQQWLFAKKFLK